MKRKNKLINQILQPYYLLFGLTIFLIIAVIIANYKTGTNFDPNYIKNLPWQKRTSYLKKKELISKLKDKKFYTDKDLILINELIGISKTLEDKKTLEYAERLKYSYLVSSLKEMTGSSNINILKNMSFKEKLSLYTLTGNKEYLMDIMKNSDKIQKIMVLLILKQYYPNEFEIISKNFMSEDIKYIEKFLENMGDNK